MPGRPCNASSIGVVIERSTSGGAKPGAWVVTSTCSGEMSGSASNGRRCMLKRPAATSAAMRMSTSMRLPRAASTILLIMAMSPSALVRNGGLHQSRLEPITALADDWRASREPARDLVLSVCDQAGMNRAPGELAISCRDEHDALSIDFLQAFARHHHAVVSLRCENRDGREHVHSQCAVRIWHLAPYFGHSGGRLDRVGNVGDMAGKNAPRKGVHSHFHGVPNLDQAEILLRHVGLNPNGRKVRYGEDRLRRIYDLSGCDRDRINDPCKRRDDGAAGIPRRLIA